MNEKRKNEQLERFFQHNPIEDPLYFKKYVKDHPDHKMAWYLLGREYAANGKDAKAAYCFAQAGEIYEAFESQKVAIEKDDLDKALIANTHPAVSGRKRGEAAKWKWGVLAALLLFVYIPASVDMARKDSKAPELPMETTSAVKEASRGGTIPNEKQSPLPTQDGTKIYYTEGEWHQDLLKMVVPEDAVWSHSLLVEGNKTKDGKWIEWYESPKILLGVEHNEVNKDQAQIHYYDPGICSCEAGDISKLVSVVENWRQEREEAVVLSSAIAAYTQKTGVLPEKAEQLYKNYPDNLLPGITPHMQSLFPQVLKEKKDDAAGQTLKATPQSTTDPASTDPTNKEKDPNHPDPVHSSKAAAASLSTPLKEPLQILIDKDKHRLALVSGNFVIRSYPVGLGGNKTPEGAFMISEKVRNPNGKSNGEFGSRGMTLSDTLFAIHGTNKPASIGKDESHGCIRMLQEDIEELYDMVPQQTNVKIGRGIIPDSAGEGDKLGKPSKPFQAPLQTDDSNPKKKYKWLD